MSELNIFSTFKLINFLLMRLSIFLLGLLSLGLPSCHPDTDSPTARINIEQPPPELLDRAANFLNPIFAHKHLKYRQAQAGFYWKNNGITTPIQSLQELSIPSQRVREYEFEKGQLSLFKETDKGQVGIHQLMVYNEGQVRSLTKNKFNITENYQYRDGLLTRIDYSNDPTPRLITTIDKNTEVQSRIFPNGETYRDTFRFNENGQITYQSNHSITDAELINTFRYAYDNNGRIKHIETQYRGKRENKVTFNNRSFTQYAYNEDGWIIYESMGPSKSDHDLWHQKVYTYDISLNKKGKIKLEQTEKEQIKDLTTRRVFLLDHQFNWTEQRVFINGKEKEKLIREIIY